MSCRCSEIRKCQCTLSQLQKILTKMGILENDSAQIKNKLYDLSGTNEVCFTTEVMEELNRRTNELNQKFCNKSQEAEEKLQADIFQLGRLLDDYESEDEYYHMSEDDD